MSQQKMQPASETPRLRFKRAYRMARTAIRGAERAALRLDLLMTPDYSPTCRRCNAGQRVAAKVAAAVGYGDQFRLTFCTAAVLLALGSPRAAQSNLPHRLDHTAWIEARLWTAEVRKAA